MSIVSAQTDIAVIDSANALPSLFDTLVGLPIEPPSLYLDLEGVNLGRHGSISILSLYVLPRKKIYLIDIHRLGKTAFSTTNSSATSLKTILESPTIPKVIFDVLNDSDALFSHYQISVDGMKDLQLMELATRNGSKDFVAGLKKCIDENSPVSTATKAEWLRTKEGTHRFNERPMRPETVQYCAQDVALLPGLYNVYNAKLRLPDKGYWELEVQQATKDRVKLSQRPDYDGQAKTKVRGPWTKEYIEQAIDDWNEEVMDNALHGEDDLLDEFELDLLYEALNDEDFEDDPWDDNYEDKARDCIGWEEDMIKNGEWF